jgi:hypothetical protein
MLLAGLFDGMLQLQIGGERDQFVFIILIK